MARINRSPRFKRNYKKLMRKHYDMSKIDKVIRLLALEKFDELINHYDDHPLHGNLAGKRVLHIEDNWILIYQKRADHTYNLVIINLEATGNHEEYKK